MKKYVSVDIEASGRIPGKYSMLSIGACIVSNTELQFYRELKPLNSNYLLEAMKISALGLICTNSKQECNPNNKNFRPDLVLEVLEEKGEDPTRAMYDFKEWILNSTKNDDPIIAAAPIKFDGMFISWYFHNFINEDPFGHSGEDMNSMYRGLTRNIYASMKDLKVRNERGLSHNALEDAIQQAKEFEIVLSLLEK